MHAPPPPPPTSTSASMLAPPSTSAVFDITEHTINGSHIREYPQATANSQTEPLLLHVKQYVPKNPAPSPSKGYVTVIGGHCNGFQKELYEPLWEDFRAECEKRGVGIRAIWVADCAWQGQSGILNGDRLGNEPSWNDYSRDILQMINHFRMPRPIIAIAHSFSAIAMLNLALMHPRLFSSMVIMEPVIAGNNLGLVSLVKGSIRRRDQWPSREAARASFAKNPFYQSWDPRVLEKWMQFGIRGGGGEGGDPTMRLSTTKHMEGFTFIKPAWHAFDESGTKVMARRRAPDFPFQGITSSGVSSSSSSSDKNDSYVNFFYRPEPIVIYARLAHIQPGVLYIDGGKSAYRIPEVCEERASVTGTGQGGSGGRAIGRVKSVTEPDAAHFIAFEKPRFCAQAAAEWWADNEYFHWQEEEKDFEEWKMKPREDKVTMSEEFKRRAMEMPETEGQAKAGAQKDGAPRTKL